MQLHVLVRRIVMFTFWVAGICITGCDQGTGSNASEYTPETRTDANQMGVDSLALPIRDCEPFPVHPPRATDFKVIPRSLLVGLNDTISIENIIHEKLLPALDNAGYEYSFYCIKDSGLAIVTRVERMNEDGTSDIQNRYVEGTKSDKFWDYLKSLIKARPGFYRCIVFIISPYAVVQSKKGLSRDGSDSLFQNGSDRPYDDILKYLYSKKYQCTALIYQYKKPNGVDEVIEIKNSSLTVIEQLTKANIWTTLSKK